MREDIFDIEPEEYEPGHYRLPVGPCGDFAVVLSNMAVMYSLRDQNGKSYFEQQNRDGYKLTMDWHSFLRRVKSYGLKLCILDIPKSKLKIRHSLPQHMHDKKDEELLKGLQTDGKRLKEALVMHGELSEDMAKLYTENLVKYKSGTITSTCPNIFAQVPACRAVDEQDNFRISKEEAQYILDRTEELSTFVHKEDAEEFCETLCFGQLDHLHDQFIESPKYEYNPTYLLDIEGMRKHAKLVLARGSEIHRVDLATDQFEFDENTAWEAVKNMCKGQ